MYMTESPPMFSVFTATHNRAHTLQMPFDALMSQTYTNFEWIVVDDGSTDSTPERLASFRQAARFPVRVFRQENGGKHRASNVGIREARGRYFVFLDSDDRCVPSALERFAHHWEALDAEGITSVSTVTALCMTADGQTVGPPFPQAVMDVRDPWEQFKLRSSGERWGVNRTDILMEHPFPEFSGERFIPESIVWNRIALRYSMRFVNEPLRVYEALDDGLSARSADHRMRSPRGTTLTYAEMLEFAMPLTARARTLVNYYRFLNHSGGFAGGVGRALLTRRHLPAALLGAAAAMRDRTALEAPARVSR